MKIFLFVPSSPSRLEIKCGLYAVGKSKETRLQKEEETAINSWLCASGTDLIAHGATVPVFKRAQIRATTYFSQNYERVQKRNGYAVLYRLPEDEKAQYGLVLFYVLIGSCFLAVIRNLQHGINNTRGFLPRNITVVTKGNLQAIPIDYIKEKCVFIEVNDLPMYILRFPNFVEQS